MYKQPRQDKRDMAQGGWNTKIQKSGTTHQVRTERKASQPSSQSVDQEPYESTRIWLNPGLDRHDEIANLDDQRPATLYYLDLVRNIPGLIEVYVEELERDRIKYWAVLAERDYDAMDSIYDIEESTLDHFPTTDIRFRVTVASQDGPSISPQATKIYDAR